MPVASQPHAPETPTFYIEQDYDAYTEENHLAWRELMRRRVDDLAVHGSRVFNEGMAIIGLDVERVPRLRDVNANLWPRTRWQARAVGGYLPPHEFFLALSRREFPTTVTVRPLAQLDYLPEPDIFHDVFGHVPMHASPVFADFLQAFGEAGVAARTEQELTELQRLFWFTVEFGLIHEDGRLKVYGSGLCSSAGEGRHCLTDAVEKRPFDLERVCATTFEIDHYQPVLYVLESFEQLREAMQAKAAMLKERP